MGEKNIYVDVMITALRKKVEILERLEQAVFTETNVLKKSQVTIEEIEATEDDKAKALEELEKADEGFEQVYNRVKDELQSDRFKYEEEIKTMQGLIRTITDCTTKIQAQEIRNKQLMEYFLQAKKNEVRAFKRKYNATAQYTSHLPNRETGRSYFLDNKK